MKQIIPGLWEIDEVGNSVHCYLWEWEAGVTLIDAGFPQHGPLIQETLLQHNYPLHRVKRIIVTHVDLDHTGGLAHLKRATRARIACHAAEKAFMEEPAKRYPANIFARLPYWMLTQLPAYQHRPVSPDELLLDGQLLPEGFTVIHTPGHTPGHISLLHKKRRLLITGDALSNRGGKLRKPLPIYTPDMKNALRSLWKLAKKHGDEFEVMAFGHGPPILQNGGKRLKAMVGQIFSTNI